MIKRGFNKIIRTIELRKRKSFTQNLLHNNLTSDSRTSKFLNVLKKLKNKQWTTEEMNAINKIEKIRNDYTNSTEVITVTDYGAGNPNSDMTKEEMQNGIESKIKVSNIYKIASTSETYGAFIFQLIREFKPKNCLELGTSLGISGAYQIAALQLNEQGKLTTIEGSSQIAELAKSTFEEFDFTDYEVHKGKFNDVLPNILHQDNALDFVFIDGHHDKAATLDYYEQIYPYLSEKAIVIFDDINWSKGMQEVWRQISQKGNGIVTSFDLYYWGVCFVDKSADNKVRTFYKIAL